MSFCKQESQLTEEQQKFFETNKPTYVPMSEILKPLGYEDWLKVSSIFVEGQTLGAKLGFYHLYFNRCEKLRFVFNKLNNIKTHIESFKEVENLLAPAEFEKQFKFDPWLVKRDYNNLCCTPITRTSLQCIHSYYESRCNELRARPRVFDEVSITKTQTKLADENSMAEPSRSVSSHNRHVSLNNVSFRRPRPDTAISTLRRSLSNM
jgi:hypothetical protein